LPEDEADKGFAKNYGVCMRGTTLDDWIENSHPSKASWKSEERSVFIIHISPQERRNEGHQNLSFKRLKQMSDFGHASM